MSIIIVKGRRFIVEGGVPTTNGLTFSISLDQAARVSAGVFSTEGKLIRVLFANVEYTSGTHNYTWDGTNDQLEDLPSGDYKIIWIDSNTTYDWNVIGNTSTSLTGSTVHKSFYPMANVAYANNAIYYTVGYNERGTGQFMFNTSTPNTCIRVQAGRFGGQSTEHVCTDDTRMYWTGDVGGGYFTYASLVSDNSEVTFSSGTSYQSYSALNDVVNTLVTGTAVQKTGNYFYTAYKDLNSIHVCNKLTGAAVTNISITAPRQMVIDNAGYLWITSGNNTVTKYTINNNGSITTTGVILTGFILASGLGIDSSNNIAVVDAGTVNQIKCYSTTGTLQWTLGQTTQYSADPIVLNDKFMFENTSIAFQPDDSFWVVDRGNCRMLHFSSTRTHLDTVSYIPHFYNAFVDPGNPARVFGGLDNYVYEFTVGYFPSVTWTLAKNYAAMIPVGSALSSVTTLSNGRTYGLQYLSSGYWKVVELMNNAPLRDCGNSSTFGNTYTRLFPDGSMRELYSFAGQTGQWRHYPLTGFDSSGNPQWSAYVTDATSPILVSGNDPIYSGTGFPWEKTSSNVYIMFNTLVPDNNNDLEYHLGAVKTGVSGWYFKTARNTIKNYRGPYPTDGSFDIGNSVNAYGGSSAHALDRSIYWGYHGEFWKAGQVNKWNHLWDNGLPVGQFGAAQGGEAVAGMAGNAFSSRMCKVGNDHYLYHCDESYHAGVHQWKISGLNTIQEHTINITIAQPYPDPVVDPTDMMNVLDYDSVLVDGDGGWHRSSGELSDPPNNLFLNIKTFNAKYLPRETGDISMFRSNTGGSDNIYKDFPTYIAGRTTWKLSGELNFNENEPFGGNTLVEVYDNNNVTIAQFKYYLEFNEGAGNPYHYVGNDIQIGQETGVDGINRVFATQPFEFYATSSGIRFTYSDFTPLLVAPYVGSNWQNPKGFKVTMNGSYGKKLDIVSLKISIKMTSGKIPIYTDRIYEITNSKNREIERLFDDTTPQKINLSTGLLITPYKMWYEFPDGQDVTLEKIEMVDGQGSAISPTRIFVITQEEAKKVNTWNRTLIYDFYGKEYNKTISYELPIPLKVKYLIIEVVNYFIPDKLYLYGKFNENFIIPNVKCKTPTLFKNQIGLNFFSWNVIKDDWTGRIDEAEWENIKYCSIVRHYHDWGNIQPTENKLDFDEKWSLKTIYSKFKQEGIEAIPCIKKLPTWIMSTYPKANLEYVPVDKYGLDKSLPQSYTYVAKLFTYFTAFFGRSKVDKSIFGGRVKEGFLWDNPKERLLVADTGLDLIKRIELGNETDAWWLGIDGYQSPAQFAAKASACYDGHKGFLGDNIGIKVIDPTMKVVMAGTAMSKLDYLRAIVDWCKQYRGYKADGTVDIPFDEWNYHIYANTDGNEQYTGKPKKALPPEKAAVDKVLQRYYNYQAELGIDVPIYITETGYDNNYLSTQAPTAIDNIQAEKIVADWTLRTSLLYSRLGLSGLTYYMLPDRDSSFSKDQYATSGFINRLNSKWLKQAKEVLGEYKFSKNLSTGGVEIDEYIKDDKKMFVAWIIDSSFSHSIEANNLTTYNITQSGVISKQTGINNIKLSETPIFYEEFDGIIIPIPPVIVPPVVVTPKDIKLEATSLQFKGEITFKTDQTNYTITIK